jgi:hypothetical protein
VRISTIEVGKSEQKFGAWIKLNTTKEWGHMSNNPFFKGGKIWQKKILNGVVRMKIC